jgi:hypothetical protein
MLAQLIWHLTQLNEQRRFVGGIDTCSGNGSRLEYGMRLSVNAAHLSARFFVVVVCTVFKTDMARYLAWYAAVLKANASNNILAAGPHPSTVQQIVTQIPPVRKCWSWAPRPIVAPLMCCGLPRGVRCLGRHKVRPSTRCRHDQSGHSRRKTADLSLEASQSGKSHAIIPTTAWHARSHLVGVLMAPGMHLSVRDRVPRSSAETASS